MLKKKMVIPELLKYIKSRLVIGFIKKKSLVTAILLSMRGELFSFSEGDWYFRVTRSRNKNWIAWCARSPLVAHTPMWEPPSTSVWFRYGQTKEEAIAKLKAEVLK